MIKNIKRVFCCCISICIIFFGANYVGKLLDPKWSSGSLNSIKAFHKVEDNSLDVIIYGSSHAWKGCDPKVMEEKYEIQAYNYGCNWQCLNTTLLFLEDSLRSQTPKVVCIETFKVDELEHDTDMDGQIYYTRAISSFDGKRQYLKYCFGNDIERYASYYFPLIMFHDNWSSISKENFVDYRKVNDYIESKGYEYAVNDAVDTNLRDYSKFKEYEIPDESLKVLNKMVEVCKEKGIEIIFYTAPYEGEYHYSNAMKTYAENNGCMYINLFEHIDEMDINEDADFRDKTHLNDLGSKKVADYLGKIISQNYNLK